MSTHTLQSIHEFNLAYLYLVRKICTKDIHQGMRQFNLTQEGAAKLLSLDDQALTRLARTSCVMAQFDLKDHELLTQLADSFEKKTGNQSVLSQAREAISVL